MTRKPYPSDVTDDEWVFVAPYLTLMKEDAPQRDHDLRAVLNGLRWIVRTGAQWRMMPNDLPPWYTVYQQAQRRIAASVFEDMVHDLRALLRLAKGKKGSKIHIAVDTLGLLLAAHVTPANEQELAQVKELAQAVQNVTQNSVEVAFVDQGYTGDNPKGDAKDAGMELIVVKLPEDKKGFVLLPRRWVVERSFAWTTRFRRLARDFERTPETFRSLHFLAFAILMLHNFVKSMAYIL
jgi:transposase